MNAVPSEPIVNVPFKKRNDCRGCRSNRLKIVIDYGPMPLAGSFLASGDVGRERLFPLTLLRCRDCTLMQVPEVVDPQIIFDQYSYASSTTQTLIGHFADMAHDIVGLGITGDDLVVEFGCNDGVLVRPLRQLGVNVVGVDPSDVARLASEAKGWPLIGGYFNRATASEVLSRHGRAKVIVGNNVFAHVDETDEILAAVSTVLREDGMFVFEVQYQGDLIRDFQFDTVYHEHLCYYSVRSLVTMLGRFDMAIVDVQPIPIHAGSIRVLAAPNRSHRSASPAVERYLDAERHWNIERFAAGVEDRRFTLRKLIQDLRSAGRRVVAYGAAGRATTLLNYCKLDTHLVEYVADMSPLRQGRLVPGVRVPIYPIETFHERYPDYALMTAWNYEPEIIQKERGFLAAGGRFVIPLANVRIAS